MPLSNAWLRRLGWLRKPLFTLQGKRPAIRLDFEHLECRELLSVSAPVMPAPGSPAPIPGLFNTGVDDQGNLLPEGVTDSHYQLIFSPDPTEVGNPSTVLSTNNGNNFPFNGYWFANGPNSNWIAPHANENDFNGDVTELPGTYIYETTFDLTGFDPSTAQLNLEVAADNTLAIQLNGVDVGYQNTSPEQFRSFTPSTISSGFVAGINKLDFVVTNNVQTAWPNNLHNPSGLRVEMSGTAVPCMLEDVYWTGQGNGFSWNDPQNWSIDALPDSCDDVFIHAQPGLTIEHPAGDVSIHSLHSENAINFGGSLTLAADSDIQKALDFNGDLDQIAGALALNGGGTITGNFHTETAGASFDFLAGKFTDNGSMFDGEGGTQVGGTGQQVVYLAPLPPQPASPEVTTHRDNFELAKGGIIEKGGTWVQAAKTFTWTGGTMRGTGVTQINFGATLTITGADTKTLDGRSLQSIGQVSATGGDIEVSNGAVLTNQFLGTFTLAGANIVQKGKVLGSFVNESVVQQTVGTTISIDFVNKGTVLANNPNDLTFITKRK